MSKRLDNIVVGLGSTGLSVARYLHTKKTKFAVVDNKHDLEQLASLKSIDDGIEFKSGEFDSEYFKTSDTLVVSPGVAVSSPAIKEASRSGVEVIGDIEIFARNFPKNSKLAAVTGSNGKSTCVTLLYEMAKAAGIEVRLGGNVGTPALDILDSGNGSKVDLYILELSSFQLETTESLNCDVACVLNISPDHLDRYSDFQAYIKAKKRLTNQTQKIIICVEDKELASWDLNIPKICFSLSKPKDKGSYGVIKKGADLWLAKGDKPLFNTKSMALKGRHNMGNALAALIMAETLGLPHKAIFKALREFGGLSHRTQFVAEINGVSWINDSKGTNVGATIAAIKGFADSSNIILLAGGQTKGANLIPLQEAMAGNVKKVILFGEDAQIFREVLQDFVDCELVSDLKVACKLAEKEAVSGDIILLSPAGASFDMFTNFAERGDKFVEIVEALQ